MKPLLWFITTILVATYICGPIVDPDLWWHITIGRWIIANHTTPTVELWNLYALGQNWIAYSWLFETSVAAIEEIAGVQGLLTYKFLLSLILCFSLAYVFGRVSKSWTFGLILGAFASCACFSHLTLRPQLIIWIIFTWLLYFAQGFLNAPIKTKDRLIILVLFCLWSNLHLTQALGLGTLVLWTGTKVNYRKSLLFGLWAILGTFLTPYFGAEWAVFFSKTTHPFAYASITEFHPLTILDYASAFLILGLLLLGALVHQNLKALSLSQYICILAFSLAAAGVAKFLPFAVIIICFGSALVWGKFSETGQENHLLLGLQQLIKMLNNIPEQGLAFLLIVLSFINFKVTWLRPLDTELLPVTALDFMQDNNLPQPWLHEFGQGGYVMYRLSDQQGNVKYPVVIDGRTNVNPMSVWQAYQDASSGSSNWFDFVTMTKANTILWRQGSPFVTLLKESNDWCQVFSSGRALGGHVVLVRNQFKDSLPCQQ